MSEFATMSKRMQAEIVHFIAENEKLASVEAHLAGSFTVAEIRAALRDVACRLKNEAAAEGESDSHEVCLETEISPQTKQIISSLHQSDKEKLLAAFGLTSK
ncbi:MAG: hypothetical protein WC683_15225 [bacterium]